MASLRAQLSDKATREAGERDTQRKTEEEDARRLKEQLSENTRQMMEAQARLANEREEQSSTGLFSRLRKKFRD